MKRQRQVDKITPIQQQLEEYWQFYALYNGECFEDMVERRNKHSAEIASRYYSLVGAFFEFRWGRSFHLYPRRKNETPAFAVRKVEYKYALKLQLQPGEEVIVSFSAFSLCFRLFFFQSGGWWWWWWWW